MGATHRLSCALFAALLLFHAAAAEAQEDVRVLQLEMAPVRRAQIAVWIESADGTYLRTLGLTQAVAVRGVGNRPGASQMNSGFQWPYGRREGVLPVWAHRRASAPSAELFRRVIFQNRSSEGWASRSASDFSRDDYYCLSFNQEASSRDQLDAVTCPSVFNSDKGRYLTDDDLASGYAEPFQTAPGEASMRPMELTSLYPPRRDVTRCEGTGCYDHADVDLFAEDARRVFPELDAVTMATPPEGALTTIAFTVPDEWPDGSYVVYVEVNTEGDYNDHWDPTRFPTPTNPASAWDSWAINYGYPFRGQPSVVYRIPVELTFSAHLASTSGPWGYGSIDGLEDTIHEMDDTITVNPAEHRGSGGDRLFLQPEGWRARVTVIGPEVCEANSPPSEVASLVVSEHSDRSVAHRFAHLSFAAASDDSGIARYEVRVSREPVTDEESFMRALPAQAATLEHEALIVPTAGEAGDLVEVDMGGLTPETRYHVAIRAIDQCNEAGPIAVTDFTTLDIQFTTVSPCFVATAAYGTPMAHDIRVLRRFRDRHLRTNAPGRAAVAFYEAVGPHFAAVIRQDDDLRAAARAALAPLVTLAGWLD